MSRKPGKKKNLKRTATSTHYVPKRQWSLKPLRKWITDMSEKVIDVYALPLTRLTEEKIKVLKSKLRASAQSV